MSPTSNWETSWSRWNNSLSSTIGYNYNVPPEEQFWWNVFQAIEGSEGFAGVDWICGTFDVVAKFLEDFRMTKNNVMTLSRNVAKNEHLCHLSDYCSGWNDLQFVIKWILASRLYIWWGHETPDRLCRLCGGTRTKQEQTHREIYLFVVVIFGEFSWSSIVGKQILFFVEQDTNKRSITLAKFRIDLKL